MDRMSINIRDPYILVENGMYYLYRTTRTTNDYERPEILCYISKDLENYDGPYLSFDSKDFWADRDYWAPEVHKYRDHYYMFVSFKAENRCRGTQILVSERPEGPYTPLTDKPYTPEGWECLDGTFYVEGGVPYSVFAHEWVQIKDGTFCLVTLSEDLRETVSEPKVILTASEAPWTKSFKEDCYVTDGPFIWKMSDGSLIMIWSSFSDTGYSLGQAKSVNGINGPWVHIDKTLFKNDGGHGMIFRDLNGKLMLTIHQPNRYREERAYFFEIEERDGILSMKIT